MRPADIPDIACGVDLVDLGSFKRTLEATGGELVDVCFTQREQEETEGEAHRLAARFAAKEAAAKALGVGLMRGVSWQDIELLRGDAQPELALSGGAAEEARRQGWYSWSVSISHEGLMAVAMVVALRHDSNEGSQPKND